MTTPTPTLYSSCGFFGWGKKEYSIQKICDIGTEYDDSLKVCKVDVDAKTSNVVCGDNTYNDNGICKINDDYVLDLVKSETAEFDAIHESNTARINDLNFENNNLNTEIERLKIQETAFTDLKTKLGSGGYCGDDTIYSEGKCVITEEYKMDKTRQIETLEEAIVNIHTQLCDVTTTVYDENAQKCIANPQMQLEWNAEKAALESEKTTLQSEKTSLQSEKTTLQNEKTSLESELEEIKSDLSAGNYCLKGVTEWESIGDENDGQGFCTMASGAINTYLENFCPPDSYYDETAGPEGKGECLPLSNYRDQILEGQSCDVPDPGSYCGENTKLSGGVCTVDPAKLSVLLESSNYCPPGLYYDENDENNKGCKQASVLKDKIDNLEGTNSENLAKIQELENELNSYCNHGQYKDGEDDEGNPICKNVSDLTDKICKDGEHFNGKLCQPNITCGDNTFLKDGKCVANLVRETKPVIEISDLSVLNKEDVLSSKLSNTCPVSADCPESALDPASSDCYCLKKGSLTKYSFDPDFIIAKKFEGDVVPLAAEQAAPITQIPEIEPVELEPEPVELEPEPITLKDDLSNLKEYVGEKKFLHNIHRQDLKKLFKINDDPNVLKEIENDIANRPISSDQKEQLLSDSEKLKMYYFNEWFDNRDPEDNNKLYACREGCGNWSQNNIRPRLLSLFKDPVDNEIKFGTETRFGSCIVTDQNKWAKKGNICLKKDALRYNTEKNKTYPFLQLKTDIIKGFEVAPKQPSASP